MTYPLGIDVSSYQRTMDWQRAIDTGAKFAFCKASEGASWVDPTFAYNWQELRRRGIPHGAYHFFRPAQSVKQVERFVELVQPEQGELLVLDVENNGGLSRADLTRKVVEAVEIIYARSGRYPILYSRSSWLNSNINVGDLPKLDYWLAQYRYPLPYPFFTGMFPTEKIDIPAGVSREQVKFHQGTDKGNGIRRGAQSLYIDMNHFIGTNEELAAYFGAAIVPPVVPPVSELRLYQARVKADVLNVRSTPEIADNVVGQLTEGAIVDVFEEVER
jgi:GH25 family lysozyme M1 (1,4-beta-N-acetylmuramidase)